LEFIGEVVKIMIDKDKKTSKKVDELVNQISELSVLDLSELVSTLQEKLGVTAAVPVAAPSTSSGQAAPAEAGAAEGAAGGGAATQTVVMTNAGANKIAVIKALREINQNLTLMDAKNMTEQVPAEVLKDAKAEDAKTANDKLKAAGATVELK
jgi:large subunit ribosomal protein L7/L12